MASSHRYLVVGPERIWVDVVCDDGTGPAFPEHDVYIIDAPTASKAKWAAFRLAKQRGDQWWRDLDQGREHPLAGVKAERVDGAYDPADWPGLYAEVS